MTKNTMMSTHGWMFAMAALALPGVSGCGSVMGELVGRMARPAAPAEASCRPESAPEPREAAPPPTLHVDRAALAAGRLSGSSTRDPDARLRAVEGLCDGHDIMDPPVMNIDVSSSVAVFRLNVQSDGAPVRAIALRHRSGVTTCPTVRAGRARVRLREGQWELFTSATGETTDVVVENAER